MREIKFRAWDNELKEMDYNPMIPTAPYAEDESLNESINFLNSGRSILMQYTGLKDKNGKEIYEGDILKWNVNKLIHRNSIDFNTTLDSPPDNYSTYVSKIIFENGAFKACTDKNSKTLLHGDIPRNEIGEVIGNIYKNPELLEK